MIATSPVSTLKSASQLTYGALRLSNQSPYIERFHREGGDTAIFVDDHYVGFHEQAGFTGSGPVRVDKREIGKQDSQAVASVLRDSASAVRVSIRALLHNPQSRQLVRNHGLDLPRTAKEIVQDGMDGAVDGAVISAGLGLIGLNMAVHANDKPLVQRGKALLGGVALMLGSPLVAIAYGLKRASNGEGF